jgi:hypothetical protein
MIKYTTSKTSQDLSEITILQKSNLRQNLTATETQNQGFLTVSYSLETLQKMQDKESHIIAKDNDKIVGYVLALTEKSRFDIPVLAPMFETFDLIQYKEKLVSSYNYIAIGQICIDKEYRANGLFDGCYEAYKNHFKNKYDFAITEIATDNKRSRAAHKRNGFEEIHTYKDFNDVEWVIVILEWNGVNNCKI